MSGDPLVSIIVPCFNQAKYLPDTLDSVLSQEYQSWECIVVNDGSTDNTEFVARLYCEKDSRIKYLHKDNGGLSSARNFGIKASNGKYILPLDSDDKIGVEYCKMAVNHLEANESTKILYCRCAFFGVRSGEYILPDFSLERILGQNIIFCSAFFRRSDYDLTVGYNENMKYGLEDWDFWLSILETGGKVVRLNEILFYYRIRVNSMSRSLNNENYKILRKQIWLNHKGLYGNNFLDPTLTYEYLSIANSLEYKIGLYLIKPLRSFHKMMNMLKTWINLQLIFLFIYSLNIYQ